MDLNTLTDQKTRKTWRDHLTGTAMNEMQAETEQGEYDDAEYTAFARGMALVIANATYREHESTSALEDEVYQQIIDVRTKAEEKYQRERWVRAVGTGATDKGFREWLADRD